MNRSINLLRRLILAAQCGLTMLLLTLTAQAQIAVLDGDPLTIQTVAANTIDYPSFTVSPGASVLIVCLVDKNQNLPEPATLNWNGQTLTRDIQTAHSATTSRSLAIYHLFNPTPGTADITGTMIKTVNQVWMTAYTLTGVDTTVAPTVGSANSGGGSVSTLTIGLEGVVGGAWAAVSADCANTANAITITSTSGGSTNVTDYADGGTGVANGYVAGLSAGPVTLTYDATGTAGAQKCNFAAAVFTPLVVTPFPAAIITQPSSLVLFTNRMAVLSVQAGGTSPLSYQWFNIATMTALNDSGHIAGSKSNVLTINNLTAADDGDYVVVVTNAYGAVTSAVANVSAILPSGAYESAVITNSPFAYYSFSNLNDPSTGTVVAYDSIGSFNGVYGAASYNAFNGILGPQSTADGLVGFPDGNTALGTVANTANSFVTLPAFNLNNGAGTNMLTITAWINPQGPQAHAVGIVFCRAGTTVAGLNYNNADANGNFDLGYTWNNEGGTYGWDSGLVPPPNTWSLVSLVITPTNATIYLLNTNGLQAATHVYAHVVQKFDGPTLIGLDSNNVNRTFNGSIDEVAFFGQALTPNQMFNLFSAASGISAFPASIGADPAWTPNPIYVGQSANITVSATGSQPLTYQWMAAPTNSSSYVNLTDGGNISGVTTPTLTITNAQISNFLNYAVRVSNAYGVVTSTVPATLTVLPPGPPINFALNYGGNPVVEGIGADWNSANVWNPGGLPASTSAIFGNPGSSYEIVVGSRMRNPAATTYNAFPGAKLIVDGDGIIENNTLNGVGEIRFKNSAAGAATDMLYYSTNYFSDLVLNGGQLNIGDNTTIVIQGQVTAATNSILYNSGNGVNETFQIDAYLTGNGGIQFYNYNATNLDTVNSVLDITGTTNTFKGTWDIEMGVLVGNGNNSLGTNSITINTNGILETAYPLNNPNSQLILNGQVYLTQNDTFQFVLLNGTPLAPGTYSAATLSASYPGNFPATFPAVYGSTATSASGQITVLVSSIPVAITTQPMSIRAITNTMAAFSVSATGYPLNYQWYEVSGGVTNAIADATSPTYTTAPVQDSDSGTGYFVVVSNQNNTVTSSTAILTAGHLVLTAGTLRNDQYFDVAGGLAASPAILTSQLYPASAYVAANPPSKTEYLSKFDGNQDLPDNAGQIISGWFTPAVSGDYVFFMTADDAGALWLSTDNTPENAYQIAQAQAYMTLRDWTCSDTNSLEYKQYPTSGEWRSDQFELGGGLNAFAGYIYGWNPYPNFNYGDGGIPLVAGTPYYIELDTYQGNGGQNAAVTYKLAGNADPSSNSPSLLMGNNISALAPDVPVTSSQPVITHVTLSGQNVILSGTNGLMNAAFNLLSTTNLANPLSNWTVTASGQFDVNGDFVITNAIVPGAQQTFYRLQQE